ncbi:MAG: FAD-dependent oxidoreductase [Caulobacterales bacterium]|uniref:FAD-dependent oxidoreductase n=1 Tax=Glycocaulis sp. TaxID=1969725 RepID=UPI003F9F1923
MDDTQKAAPPPWAAGTENRMGELYPTLTASQMERLRKRGTRKSWKAGETVWAPGERSVEFHLVEEGRLDIVRPVRGGAGQVIISHGPGRYSGETTLMSGRASLVGGVAGSDLVTTALSVADLRETLSRDAELSELILHSFILRRMRMIAEGLSGVLVIGSPWSAGTMRVRDFLTRNGHPHTFVDLEEADDIEALLDGIEIAPEDTPLVYTEAGAPLRNPSLLELAQVLGIATDVNPEEIFDLAVIGAGPAGLASAVYAASEGLRTVVLETTAPGGQAGTSSKIENYLGFPTGISGQALAGRAYNQATKFGAQILLPCSVERLACEGPRKRIELDDGRVVRARAVVIASGAQYRKLELDSLERFEGAGIHYGASHIEAGLCRGEDVVIVGGGNSAGQAAIHLAAHARHVTIMVRREGLEDTMSRYLIARIEQAPNITLKPFHEIIGLEGSDHLERIRWRDNASGETGEMELCHLFLFVGADPCTRFLGDDVAVDEKGFVKTGPALSPEDLQASRWPLARQPFLLETSKPNVFAAGDVRSASVKRVASAVGEGSICVQFIHQALAGG